jgi:hypothetical protein
VPLAARRPDHTDDPHDFLMEGMVGRAAGGRRLLVIVGRPVAWTRATGQTGTP